MNVVISFYELKYVYIKKNNFLVYMMLAPVNEHTAINEKTKSRNNKWVHLGDEKRETVSPRNNFEDLNTSNLYFDIKITILATVPIMLMILICWYFR